jgi:hypothetical protein
MLGLGLCRTYLSVMEQQPNTVVERLARALQDFTARQKPATQDAIANALHVVNDWLSRLQKK